MRLYTYQLVIVITITVLINIFPVCSIDTGPCNSIKNATPSLFSFQTGNGTLLIYSCPPDAAVLINSKNVGRTPIRIEKVQAGSYNVQLKKEGYLDYLGTATVISGKTGEMTIFLTSPTDSYDPNKETSILNNLIIKTNPGGARIFIDGNEVGTTPTEFTNLQPGTHKILLTRDGYMDWEMDIPMTVTSVVTIDTMLYPKVSSSVTAIETHLTVTPPPVVSASLNLTSYPAGAEVVINGESKGVTPLRISPIDPGPYNLNLKSEGYKDWVQNFKVSPGIETNLTVHLIRVIKIPPLVVNNGSTPADKIENARYQTLLSLSDLLSIDKDLSPEMLVLENTDLKTRLEKVKAGLANSGKQFDSIEGADSSQKIEIEQMKDLIAAGTEISLGLSLLSDSVIKTTESVDKINETGSHDIAVRASDLLKSSEDKFSRAKMFIDRIKKPVINTDSNTALIGFRSLIQNSTGIETGYKKYNLPLQQVMIAKSDLSSSDKLAARGNKAGAKAGYMRAKEEVESAQKNMLSSFSDPVSGQKLRNLFTLSQDLIHEIEFDQLRS